VTKTEKGNYTLSMYSTLKIFHMKKLLLVTALILSNLGSFTAWGQSSSNLNKDRCASHFNGEKLKQLQPKLYQKWSAVEEHYQAYRKARQLSLDGTVSPQRVSDPQVTITIPVVVHVVWNTAEQNISDAQIQSQIDVLNEDYRRRNADARQTPSQFAGVATDVNIEFKLACVDPNGNPTTGIVRANTGTTGFRVSYLPGDIPDETTIGVKFVNGAAAWPSGTYLNIWTCNFVDTTLGYGRFPGTAAANVDGVVLKYNATGRVGTLIPTYNKGRTATHEVGHWLNVFHVFGTGNCTDDMCADTPVQQTANYGCVAFPHRTCSNNGDMSMNYMDYSDDGCMNLFTNNQKDRMRALFTTGGYRESFISTKIQQQVAQLCNGNTTFSVAANQGAVVTYNWTVTGALQLASGQGSNQITCAQNGTGAATVTVSANGYCDSRTVQIGPYNASGTYTSDFDGTPTPLTESYQFAPAGHTYYISMNQPYDFTFTTVGPNGTAGVPIYKTGPQTAYFYFPGSSVQVHADAFGAPCGTASLSSVFLAPFSFAMTPNPASSELTVTDASQESLVSQYEFKDADKVRVSLQSMPFDAALYDMYGKKVKSQTNVRSKTMFNVSDLPNGLYNLRVGKGKDIHTEHVQITH
jgi:hypothetical protein